MHIRLTPKHVILWNRNTRGDSKEISCLRRQRVFLFQNTQTPHLKADGAAWVQRAIRPRPQLSPLPTTYTSSMRASVHQTVVTTYHTVNDISTLALSSLRIMPKVTIFPNKTTRTLILLRVTNMKKKWTALCHPSIKSSC
jgi:hypothetical protein